MKKSETFHTPFSPSIMETEVPKRFLDIVNEIGDEVLSDDKKSAQWDWSNHLVGKVHKEVQIPIVNKDCLLYTSPSPRDRTRSRMPSSA